MARDRRPRHRRRSCSPRRSSTRSSRAARSRPSSPTSRRRSRRRPRRRVAEAIADLQRLNEESRKVDAQDRRGRALDKRQAEIKALAERIAKGQEKIEAEVRRRGETDLQTRTLLEQMGQTVGNLNSETAGLKKALRQPQTRGQWGELQLRRCIEIAGMTEHVDFELQETLRTEDGRLRPDAPLPAARGAQLRRRLEGAARRLPRRPGGRRSNRERRVHLERHARQAREHVRALSSKDYQGQFKAGEMPDLVICFIPNEPALHAAFGADPELFDYALERNVLLVSPTSLIGLLRTMELGWRQERMVAEAAEIADAGRHPARPLRQVPRRLRQGRQAARLGRPSAYDSAVGSMERPAAAAAAQGRGPRRRARQGDRAAASRSRSPCARSPRRSCDEASRAARGRAPPSAARRLN